MCMKKFGAEKNIIILPAKRSFSGEYYFQHVRDSEIPSTFKVFTL